jgi:hypothetical protein
MRPKKPFKDSLVWLIGIVRDQDGLDAFDSFCEAGKMTGGLNEKESAQLAGMREVAVNRITSLHGKAE